MTRETLTWELFGTAARELGEEVEADGYRPDSVLAIARGGLFVAGALGRPSGTRRQVAGVSRAAGGADRCGAHLRGRTTRAHARTS